MYDRIILKDLIQNCFHGKAIVIYGPRQVGKTTLAKQVMDNFSEKKKLYVTADDTDVQELFTPQMSKLEPIVSNIDLLVIDEAQRIENIGLVLKLLVDAYPEKQIIATGSSSFDLANSISEPLTGRAFIYRLYPLSLQETHPYALITSSLIEQRLIYGAYPDTITTYVHDPKEYLKRIINEYLYKDIYVLEGVKKHRLVVDILKALALQIGNEFSYREIANTVGADKKTVEKYIDILEQAFIIVLLRPLHTNQRREIKFNKKVYFRDLGIRNAVIGDFSDLSRRNDVGALWENYFIIERIKYTSYKKQYPQISFWRKNQAGEIDYIEKRDDGSYACYECTYSNKKGAQVPRAFADTYNNHTFTVVQPQNIALHVR